MNEQHDAHVRLWRLWNEFLMRPAALAYGFHLWRVATAHVGMPKR
jgi:hypothetical protein